MEESRSCATTIARRLSSSRRPLAEPKRFGSLSSPERSDSAARSSSLARAVLLVECRTENQLPARLQGARRPSPTRRSSSCSSAGGRGNIQLFARVCNACCFLMSSCTPRRPERESGRSSRSGSERSRSSRCRVVGGRSVRAPDFEAVSGLSTWQSTIAEGLPALYRKRGGARALKSRRSRRCSGRSELVMIRRASLRALQRRVCSLLERSAALPAQALAASAMASWACSAAKSASHVLRAATRRV